MTTKKRSSEKKSSNSIAKNQIELRFNESKESSSNQKTARIIGITSVTDKKKLDMIRRIIKSSPSY